MMIFNILRSQYLTILGMAERLVQKTFTFHQNTYVFGVKHAHVYKKLFINELNKQFQIRLIVNYRSVK